MKIVGASRLCNEFVEEIDLTIGSLAAFCDEVCFVLDHVTDSRILDAVNRCKNLAGVVQYPDEPWGHCESWAQAYHCADTFDPDWIIIQDQDEILPYGNIRDAIATAEDKGYDTIQIPPINCWESPYRIVLPKLNTTGDHCRIYKGGNPEFCILHGGGCSVPSNKPPCFRCLYPYRHMNFMRKSCRDRRRSLNCYRRKFEPWSEYEETPPPVFPYREDWEVDQWYELEAESAIIS